MLEKNKAVDNFPKSGYNNRKEVQYILKVNRGDILSLYEYLVANFKENEPIFVSEIKIEDMTDVNLRQQMKKLADSGKIKRFDSGIYFIPKKTIFHSGSQLSPYKVIEKKYLQNEKQRFGYISGLMLANQMGLTTQVPMSYEVVTNKATKDYRETKLDKTRVIIRKPRVEVTEDNYKILQFLDLICDIKYYSEVEGEQLQKRLMKYMQNIKLSFSMLEPYLMYYPDRIYKNMYETRLLYGISS